MGERRVRCFKLLRKHRVDVFAQLDSTFTPHLFHFRLWCSSFTKCRARSSCPASLENLILQSKNRSSLQLLASTSQGRSAVAKAGKARGELLAGIKSSSQAKKFPLLESNTMVYLSFVRP